MARTKKYPGVYERNDTNGKSFYFIIEKKDTKTGKRKQKKYGGYKTAQEAYHHLIDKKSALNNGTYFEATKITLNHWLEQWLNITSINSRASTLESYKYRIRHIAEGIGHIELIKLNTDDIHSFYRELQKKEITYKKNSEKSMKNLSAQTIYDIHKVLKMALARAYKDKKINHDLTKDIVSPKQSRPIHKVLKPDEVSSFLEVAKKDALYCVFYLGLFTGMRQSEILGLQWSNIDFKQKLITITETLNSKDKKILSSVKSENSYRIIEIDDETIKVLEAQKKRISFEKKHAGTLYKDYNLVCPTTIGTPLNPSNVRRNLQRVIKEAGVTRVTFHQLRHSHATLLLAAGVPNTVVGNRLGHSSTRVTEIYLHVLPGMQAEAIGKLRNLVTSNQA